MAMRKIPADEQRYPPGCPDPDWCAGNRVCYWDCNGEIADAYEQRELEAERAERAKRESR